MTDFDIIQHYADGFTAKEIAALCKKTTRVIEYRINVMREMYNAKTCQHLVAIFFRKKLIE